jgi:DNA-binding phage protein
MEIEIKSKKEFSSLPSDQKLLVEDAIRNELRAAYESNDPALIKAAEEKVTWLAKESQEEIMNATKATNRAAITDFIAKVMNDKNRIPTVIEIVQETKLSKVTVYSHLNEMRSKGFSEESMLIVSSQREKYLAAISKAACNGNLKATELVIKLIDEHFTKPNEAQPKQDNSSETPVRKSA